MSIHQQLTLQRTYTDRFTEYTQALQRRSSLSALQELADLRDFKLSTLQACDIFYIQKGVEMLLPDYIEEVTDFGVISTQTRQPIFNKRWVIPVKTTAGKIQALVGYSNLSSERYMYSTSRYYSRRDTLYGLENLYDAYEKGYALLTEGITDAIRLRDLGYSNSFAVCGTHWSPVIQRVLNRLKHGVIKIPDRDTPGIRAVQKWNVNRSITLMISLQYKDVDELCFKSTENKEWLNSYITECIRWLKTNTHSGRVTDNPSVTML